ncbi:MAG: hypothetical protein MZW92_14155 [Comamonadaceae bacterium]|nr:hypothetical protein [Comamonadaceae bacterium]
MLDAAVPRRGRADAPGHGARTSARAWLVAGAVPTRGARRSVDVAPFKAQNMSNNARVVPGLDGGWGEIGAAQYFQALAAGVAPSVEHNPVLLKPQFGVGSQVVLRGRALGNWPARHYRS